MVPPSITGPAVALQSRGCGFPLGSEPRRRLPQFAEAGSLRHDFTTPQLFSGTIAEACFQPGTGRRPITEISGEFCEELSAVRLASPGGRFDETSELPLASSLRLSSTPLARRFSATESRATFSRAKWAQAQFHERWPESTSDMTLRSPGRQESGVSGEPAISH